MDVFTRDKIYRPPLTEEQMDVGESMTDSLGYISAEMEINNLLRAGAVLEDWRRRGGVYDSEDPFYSEESAVDISKMSSDELLASYNSAVASAREVQLRYRDAIAKKQADLALEAKEKAKESALTPQQPAVQAAS